MRGIGPVEGAEAIDLVAVERPEPRGLLEVLTLHVEHHDRAREAQKVRDHEADALTRAGGRHHHHMRDGGRGDEFRLGRRRAKLAADETLAGGLQHVVLLQLRLGLPMGRAIIVPLLLPGPGECQNTEADCAKAESAKADLEGLRVRCACACAGLPERQHVETAKAGFQCQGQVEGGDDGADDGTADHSEEERGPEGKCLGHGGHLPFRIPSRHRDRGRGQDRDPAPAPPAGRAAAPLRSPCPAATRRRGR